MRLGRDSQNSRLRNERLRRIARRAIVPSCLAFIAVGSSACLFGSSKPTAAKTTTQLSAGIAAQNAGNYTAALNAYEAILKDQPSNIYALYDLGTLYQLHLNNIAKAETQYRAVLAINPNYEPALYNLAVAESPTSPAEAAALYKQVISLQPSNAAAYLNLGIIQYSLGDKATGLANLAKAHKLNSAYPATPPASLTGGTTTTTTPTSATGVS